ncbi:protein-ADP-ribose hydrolase [uncultured Gemmiger sp.]|uniref:protein-ADP-ribose hydrolase n=1 Tax=uncultured Gemmiger sp. TaxID=1623490 RepID=UPI0026668537|nr:protein-ADP-ribose hydrolase [uncultured Gemmiger sp.]
MTQTTTQEQRLDFLIRCLLNEKEEYRDIEVPADKREKQRLLRSLMNVRPPVPASDEFLKVQDAYLQERLEERGVTKLEDLTPVQPGLYLWQGDITTLAVDAIVNAANSQMLGCFVPCHGCIDNAIHTYAGVQLRLECAKLMTAQGKEEPTGKAKITKAYNLPCRYVLHTVGPIIYGAVTKTDQELLTGCYRSCLDLATAHGLRSVAFCCISTGEFHFPGKLAAEISIQTVKTWQQQNPNQIEVIFNVFKDSDYKIYKRLLR